MGSFLPRKPNVPEDRFAQQQNFGKNIRPGLVDIPVDKTLQAARFALQQSQ